jgi:hypothetical protein
MCKSKGEQIMACEICGVPTGTNPGRTIHPTRFIGPNDLNNDQNICVLCARTHERCTICQRYRPILELNQQNAIFQQSARRQFTGRWVCRARDQICINAEIWNPM